MTASPGMTAAVAHLPAAPRPRPVPILRGYGFELVKLCSHWRIRLLLAVCWIAPALFVVLVSQQGTLPADSVFGRWMHSTGWAASLVVLGFSGTWALPLLTALVAGDVFAAEDRLGTWRHLLVAVRSARRIFASKALASLTVVLTVVPGLAVSSAAAGVLAIGNHPLVGLDGDLIGPGRAAVLVLLSWACVLPPTLAFAAIGLLASVALGRSPVALVVPALLAFAMQLTQLLPLPVAVRMALPTNAFVAWRGLYTEPAQLGPLVVGVAVSVAWAAAATALAYRLFVRRDFTDPAYDGAGRRAVVTGALPLVGLLIATTAAVGIAVPDQNVSGGGIDRAKLQASLGTAFGHLYRLQTDQLHRPEVTEAQLRSTADCDKGGLRVVDAGPGRDWRCVVTWHLPGVDATGSAIYQLDVTADGRYVADGDGPKEVNGYFQVRTRTGDAPNPLWQLDGTVDLLGPPPQPGRNHP